MAPSKFRNGEPSSQLKPYPNMALYHLLLVGYQPPSLWLQIDKQINPHNLHAVTRPFTADLKPFELSPSFIQA